MSMSGQDIVDKAREDLRRHQEGLLAARKKLADVSTKMTSKDHSVTVTVNERGQLSSISFNSQKFRRMAPAELGSMLVETIAKAQEESRQLVLRTFQPFLPKGFDLPGLMAGNSDLSKMFEDARRHADEMLSDDKLRLPGDQSGPRGREEK
ncbi:MAG TPA: YbaB/EbfC family nucleoid-associated protein [Streptosporangiaceae bacterium]|nr:YbaB/EbfC family nucleoid-associated protein [Streptosporangiaceae bacterium]